MKIISPMGRSRLGVSVRGGASLEKINDRHIPVIGEYAQRIISTLTVGIIGLGGIGSILVEMIMRLLPGKIVIADDDVLELTNLNRVVGANYKDAKRALRKTDLAARTISRFNPLQDFSAVNGNFLDESIQRKFKECDVIFSATDNVSSRFAACNLCLANGIALIDVGTGVIMKNCEVEVAGGQVYLLTPDSGWCPLCAGIYSQSEISSGLLDPEELERQRSLGYVRGENVEAPQVYALNGIVSSWAVWLFMNLVSGKEITFDGIAVDAKSFHCRTWVEKRRTPNTCSYCGDDGIVMRGDDASLVTRNREGEANAPLPLATVNGLNDSGAPECNSAGNTDYCGIRSLTGLDHLRY